MILSSADILRILGGSEIIRLSAKLKIVDAKPALSGAEGLFIYVGRFPRLEEFEATWTIWIESDGSEPDDLVIAEIKKLLPRVEVRPGLMVEVTTTEFRSESTQSAPEAPQAQTAQVDLSQYEERFQALVEDVQDQMLLVTSGRPGRDGQDGRDGVDGRDGRDLVATEAELEDLQNVEEGIAKEKGQVLTWDGEKWTNLFVPQIVSSISGGGSGGTTINTLNDIGDVNVPSPGNGSVLSYDAASGNWIAVAAPPADISGNSIDDLADVDTTTSAPSLNQALVWDGSNWVPGDRVQSVNGQVGIVVVSADDIPTTGATNKFVTQQDLNKLAGIEAGAQVNTVNEAPLDGNFYVRSSGVWVKLTDALSALGVTFSDPVDAGNFTTGLGSALSNAIYDGGNFTDGTSGANNSNTIDGGLTAP